MQYIQYAWMHYLEVEMHLTSQWGIYYVLKQVTNISLKNLSELFYRVLGETAQKWQLVYEDFLLVSAF